MELCRELHAENGLFTLDENKVREMLHKAFNQEGAIIGVIGGKGKLEALILMLISNFWYSSDRHLEELFVYVRPPFRETKDFETDNRFSRARQLTEFSKWCSDQSSLPLVIGVMSDTRTEGKIRLYRRYFGEPLGTFFFYAKKKFAA